MQVNKMRREQKHTWITTVSNGVAFYSGHRWLPQQQGWSVSDINCSETLRSVQSWRTQKQEHSLQEKNSLNSIFYELNPTSVQIRRTGSEGLYMRRRIKKPTCNHSVSAGVTFLQTLHSTHSHLVQFAREHIGKDSLKHAAIHSQCHWASCGGRKHILQIKHEKGACSDRFHLPVQCPHTKVFIL